MGWLKQQPLKFRGRATWIQVEKGPRAEKDISEELETKENRKTVGATGGKTGACREEASDTKSGANKLKQAAKVPALKESQRHSSVRFRFNPRTGRSFHALTWSTPETACLCRLRRGRVRMRRRGSSIVFTRASSNSRSCSTRNSVALQNSSGILKARGQVAKSGSWWGKIEGLPKCVLGGHVRNRPEGSKDLFPWLTREPSFFTLRRGSERSLFQSQCLVADFFCRREKGQIKLQRESNTAYRPFECANT